MENSAGEGDAAARDAGAANAFAYSVIFIGSGSRVRFEIFRTTGERSGAEMVADLAAAAVRLDREKG